MGALVARLTAAANVVEEHFDRGSITGDDGMIARGGWVDSFTVVDYRADRFLIDVTLKVAVDGTPFSRTHNLADGLEGLIVGLADAEFADIRVTPDPLADRNAVDVVQITARTLTDPIGETP